MPITNHDKRSSAFARVYKYLLCNRQNYKRFTIQTLHLIVKIMEPASRIYPSPRDFKLYTTRNFATYVLTTRSDQPL